MPSSSQTKTIAVSTTLFVCIVTLSQFLASISSNDDISNNSNSCLLAGPAPKSHSSEHSREMFIDLLSAIVFIVASFPQTLYGLYRDVANLFSRNVLTGRNQYLLERYAKKYLNGDSSLAFYDANIMRSRADNIAGLLNTVPLITKVVLTLLYGFNAFAKRGHGWEVAGYALVPVGMVLKMMFRFDDTFQAGIKLKDSLIANIGTGLLRCFEMAVLAWMAAPFGLYASRVFLYGAVNWLSNTFGHEDFFCDNFQNKNMQHFLFWFCNLAFAIPATEKVNNFFYSLFTRPIQSVRETVQSLGGWLALLLPLLLIDFYFSGWYYSHDLLKDHLQEEQIIPQAALDHIGISADSFVNIRAALYMTIMYGIYYPLSNINTLASQGFKKFSSNVASFFRCHGQSSSETEHLLSLNEDEDEDDSVVLQF